MFGTITSLYGACSFIPSSLQEAELALENGEIDSLCFIQYRTLILQPVEPLREGWSRIQELSYELDSRTFPSIPEIRAAVDAHDDEKLMRDYPWLRELEPFFTLTSTSAHYGISGLTSADISAGYFSGTSKTRVRSLLRGERTGSGGELSVVSDSTGIEPYKRVFSIYSRNRKFHFAAGHFNVVKNSLIWGAFQSQTESQSESEQWLWGTRTSWNGLTGTGNIRDIHFEGIIHARENEQLYSSFLRFPFRKLVLGGGVVVQQEQNELLYRTQVSDSTGKYLTELVVSSRDGFAAMGRMDFRGDSLSGEGEVWYISDDYSPEMSQRIKSLQRRYGLENGSAVGVLTRFRWKFPVVILESRFQGEVLHDCGRGEFTLTASSRTRVNVSFKNRIVQLRKYENMDEQFEQVLRFVPLLKNGKVRFPCTGGNLIRNGQRNRSSLMGGVNIGVNNSVALSSWCRWYQLSEKRIGMSFTLKQKIGKWGKSSLALTVPFSESDEMEMYGKATFLF